MKIALVCSALIGLFVIAFVLGSVAHELSGHPIDAKTASCANVGPMRICVGRVDYGLK